jgi:hypothetical protein
MALNKRLFHLGNQVVALEKEIQKHFPNTVNDPFNEKNPLKHALIEMLDLINNIRLAIQDEEPKDWWVFKVKCNSQEVQSVQDHIDSLILSYELTKLQTKSEK